MERFLDAIASLELGHESVDVDYMQCTFNGSNGASVLYVSLER